MEEPRPAVPTAPVEFTYTPTPKERREAYYAASSGQIFLSTFVLIAYAVMIALLILLRHEVDWMIGALIGVAFMYLLYLLQIFHSIHRLLKRDLKTQADTVRRFTVYEDHFVVTSTAGDREKARYTIFPDELGRVVRRRTVTVFTVDNLLFFLSNEKADACEPLKAMLQTRTPAQKSDEAAGKTRFLLLFWMLASLIGLFVSSYTHVLWRVSPFLPLIADLLLMAVPLSMAIYALTRKGQVKKLLLYAIFGFLIAGWILVFYIPNDVQDVFFHDSYAAAENGGERDYGALRERAASLGVTLPETCDDVHTESYPEAVDDYSFYGFAYYFLRDETALKKALQSDPAWVGTLPPAAEDLTDLFMGRGVYNCLLNLTTGEVNTAPSAPGVYRFRFAALYDDGAFALMDFTIDWPTDSSPSINQI